jgi:hypothetical protein
MGMEGKLWQVSEFELAAYRKNPAKFYSELTGRYNTPDIQNFTAKMTELQSSPVVQRMKERAAAGLPTDPADVKEYRAQALKMVLGSQPALNAIKALHIGRSQDGRELSLHKSWHCLHYLFTGKGWQQADSTLGKAILGGREIPDQNEVMGYGPARYLTPDEVSQVSAELDKFPIQERAAAYDPQAAEAAEVYVPQHEPQELRDYFMMLREFYRDAAEKGNGVLLWIE